MSRQARKRSETGIYHIMIRGINHQVIFEDDEDIRVFLETIGKYKAQANCKIYAFCLMKNHVHLLVKINEDKLGSFMRKIGAKYVYWYNLKYNRIGGLFQDRYKSEVVEDESYFLTVLRYIHQNPVKAGLCKNVEDYIESSYLEYLHPRYNQLTDIDYVLSIMNIEQFIKFNNEANNDKCLEIQEEHRINDNEAKQIIYRISKCKNPAEFQALETTKRDEYLALLKENGLSIRQIERLTGINRGIIFRKLHENPQTEHINTI
jgi:REP element-mobilizing transposase RayT